MVIPRSLLDGRSFGITFDDVDLLSGISSNTGSFVK